MATRLNKYLSEVGYCSRRGADSLIKEGKVTINSKVAEVGAKIEEEDYGGHPLYFGYVQGFENDWGSFWYGELHPLIEQGRVWEIKEIDLPHAGRRD